MKYRVAGKGERFVYTPLLLAECGAKGAASRVAGIATPRSLTNVNVLSARRNIRSETIERLDYILPDCVKSATYRMHFGSIFGRKQKWTTRCLLHLEQTRAKAALLCTLQKTNHSPLCSFVVDIDRANSLRAHHLRVGRRQHTAVELQDDILIRVNIVQGARDDPLSAVLTRIAPGDGTVAC